jgi:1-acyl-sn-glycerol-3-phosphate acyltransferase
MMSHIAHPAPFFYPLRALVRSFIKFLFRIQIEGLENLPKTPYVLISNHLSWIDPLLYLCLFPTIPQIVFIGNAATTTKNSLLNLIIFLAGKPLISFNKRECVSRIRALKRISQEARSGKTVGFFPEGRIGEEGRICPFHPGAFLVAKKMKHLVVPVGLAGAKQLYWRKPIRIRIGTPLAPQEEETVKELTVRAHKTLRKVIPSYPGDLPRPHRLAWLSKLFHSERHPFPFDGTQALYNKNDPDGYGLPEEK